MAEAAQNSSQPKGSNLINSVGGIADAAGAIATTISSIVGANKQQGFMQALSTLDQRQQQQLAEKLAMAHNDNEKLQILSSSLTQYIITNDAQGKKNNVILYATAGGLAIIMFSLVVIVSLKSKK